MMVSTRDKYFIELAYAQAVSSENAGGARHGAVVVLKNRVVSFGQNKKKTHPFQATYSKKPEALSLHAENDAIKNALKQLSVDDIRKATLYVARARRDGVGGSFRYGIAKPCSGCMGAIGTFEIKKVVYTTNEGTIESFTRK